ncbi:unnamed protein product [Rotaria socialis]|uniref:Uncharacterized protein n=1 Tax=Rotaria socialis TaxID=392032 RepID=A0A820SQ81_9BILA|nr:unnamed protein product [Rotaria socialis]CAF3368281.1 unnamed protein product [Rotaria socialis]CAF3398634.1 unnamed protein product [Rotaria socialis]CAF3620629.1 unnamed protein product [Rotaria socialis]CAF3802265.1 unnamed protein product [Rotaria socialis]
MCESINTTARSEGGLNSQLSFYEYPPHKPFTNSIHQPLRPSHNLSRTVTLPESNRDQLLSSLQSLSLKIKTLENEREQAELSLHEITSGLSQTSSCRRDRDPLKNIDEQLIQAEENFRRLQNQHKRVLQVFNGPQSSKPRMKRKKKRSPYDNHSFDSPTNAEGRHYHLDMNHVPFILGQSTSPSHNVKSNVQNVIALLKNHNHQLCLSSKEYANLVHPRRKSELSPHALLYLDSYNKQSNRPSSASPIRSTRRPIAISTTRRPQTASTIDNQSFSHIKRLRREYVILSREHARLYSSKTNLDDLEILTRRMENILEELEQLQRQHMFSSQNHSEQDLNETPIETLKRTRLLQLILKDPITKQQKH